MGPLFSGPGQNDNKKAENPFRIKAFAYPDKTGLKSKGKIKVVFNIAPGYKIYEEATSITPENIPGIKFYPLIKPPAVKKKVYNRQDRAVFHGKSGF